MKISLLLIGLLLGLFVPFATQALELTEEKVLHSLRVMEGLTPPASLWEAQRLQDTLLRRVKRIRGKKSSSRHYPQMQSYASSNSHYEYAGGGYEKQSPILSPIEFGGDPTGKEDSTAAFQKAMETMLSICDDRSFFNVDMADNIKNCGSVTLDLQGGEYIISAPLVVPMYYGNLNMERGSIRASPTFPQDKWMIEVGNSNSNETCRTNGPQQCCNEFINFQNLFLDSSHLAAGGIKITSTMGAVIAACFLTGFRNVGIKVDKGHEVMITNCWLAEYYWSDVRLPHIHSTGIQINGPDHVLSNVILFDYSHIGVEVGSDGGNVLEGVHIWNGSGTGFVIRGATRITECFVDYNKMVLVDPSYIVIQDTFFYHTYLSINVSDTGSMNNVVMTGNQYGYTVPGKTIRIEGGKLENVTNVVISNEIGGNVFTQIKTNLHQLDSKLFRFNLTDSLLVPTIKHLLYSVVWDDSRSSPYIQHRAWKPDNGIVTVEFEHSVNATVMLEVSISDTCLTTAA